VSVDFESIAYDMGADAIRNKSHKSMRAIGVIAEAKNINIKQRPRED